MLRSGPDRGLLRIQDFISSSCVSHHSQDLHGSRVIPSGLCLLLCQSFIPAAPHPGLTQEDWGQGSLPAQGADCGALECQLKGARGEQGAAPHHRPLVQAYAQFLPCQLPRHAVCMATSPRSCSNLIFQGMSTQGGVLKRDDSVGSDQCLLACI